MNIHLTLHNAIFLTGGLINFGLSIFVLYVSRRRLNVLVVTFLLMIVSVTVFQISHVLGVLASNGETSRRIFMWNLTVIPIQMFMTHWFLALIEKNKRRKIALSIVYGSGLCLFLIHLIFPETYLYTSVPKMYFPFYY